jgi:hypothetical protein
VTVLLIRNIEKRIFEVEGFEVKFMQNGKDVRGDLDINAKQYCADYAAKNSYSVSNWITKRFSVQYPGYDVWVLNGDGTKAKGQAKLSTVRDSYNNDD